MLLLFIASSLIGLLHGGHGVDIAVEELRTEGDLAGTVALLPLLGAPTSSGQNLIRSKPPKNYIFFDGGSRR